MRRIDLQESREQLLELTDGQAQALQGVGRRLASTKRWWGQEEADDKRSAIWCAPAGAGLWRVTVANAVGLVSIGQLQLAIHPKIPAAHLLYLLGRSGHFPRLEDDRALAATGWDLWSLVAGWFVLASERVLRRDLIRDYQPVRAELPIIRGRVGLQEAVADVYRGRLAFGCEFDEFSIDTALNRLLKAAACAVAASKVLNQETRRRATRLLARMDEVGELHAGDEFATVDRRSTHYSDALLLARHVLQGQGRILEHGMAPAWTFLIPTPRMVEDGLRNVLAERLAPVWDVRKRGLQLEGSTLTFNPDLVFQHGLAVGDVKYKVLESEWKRPDLYQVLAFATAFRSRHGAVVGFRSQAVAEPKVLTVGDTRVTELAWVAHPLTQASAAAAELAQATLAWLTWVSGTPSGALEAAAC